MVGSQLEKSPSIGAMSAVHCSKFLQSYADPHKTFLQLGGEYCYKKFYAGSSPITMMAKWVTISDRLLQSEETSHSTRMSTRDWIENHSDKYQFDWVVLPFELNHAFIGNEWAWVMTVLSALFSSTRIGVAAMMKNAMVEDSERMSGVFYPSQATLYGLLSVEYNGHLIIDNSSDKTITSFFLIH